MAVNMKDFEKAMTAALKGPEQKKLKIEKHEFNVKPVKITREGNKIIVSGEDGHQISHRLRFRPDDQVFYAFEKEGGIVRDLEVEIKEGGLIALVKKTKKVIEIALEVIEILKKEGKSDEVVSEAGFQETKRLLDGTWQGEANFLIANIALRVK